MGVQNLWLNKLSSRSSQLMMSYALTHNTYNQGVTMHVTSEENIFTTATYTVFINGIPYILAADTEYDISAELPYADWATATVYTTQGILSEVIGSDGFHYTPIVAHTSSANDKPITGVNWRNYWKKLDKWPVAAAGDVIADDELKGYLVCALNDGILRLFKAYDPAVTSDRAAAFNWVTPPFDPERYVAIAKLVVDNQTGVDFTVGTTDFDDATGDGAATTILPIVDPIFPNSNLLDTN